MNRHLVELTAQIVASHLANHKMDIDDLPGFVTQTYSALRAINGHSMPITYSIVDTTKLDDASAQEAFSE